MNPSEIIGPVITGLAFIVSMAALYYARSDKNMETVNKHLDTIIEVNLGRFRNELLASLDKRFDSMNDRFVGTREHCLVVDGFKKDIVGIEREIEAMRHSTGRNTEQILIVLQALLQKGIQVKHADFD